MSEYDNDKFKKVIKYYRCKWNSSYFVELKVNNLYFTANF